MIRSWRDKDSKSIFDRTPTKKFRSIAETAYRKLIILDSATELRDLSLPSLRLEKLSGDREGTYSIRINMKYRICFDWREDGAYEVEIIDYH